MEVNSELLNASQQSVHKLWELLKELDYKKIYYYDENPKLMKDFCKLKDTQNQINTNVIAVKLNRLKPKEINIVIPSCNRPSELNNLLLSLKCSIDKCNNCIVSKIIICDDSNNNSVKDIH